MVDAIPTPPAAQAPAPDLDAIQQQTQPAALKGLDDAGLAALLRDLRAMKANAGDVAVQKALAQSIRGVVAEKRQRQDGTEAAPAPAKRLDKLAAKAGKAEEKARKEAERAERKRVKEAERAEKKAAKAARKDEAGKLAESRDKAREKKLAKLGKPKAEKPKPAKDKPAKAAKDKPAEGAAQAGTGAGGAGRNKPGQGKPGQGKPGQGKLGQGKPGQNKAGQNKAGGGKAGAKAAPAAPDAAPPAVPDVAEQPGRDTSAAAALAGAGPGDEGQS